MKARTIYLIAFVALLLSAALWLQGGTPPFCEKPVCGMKSCQSFSKDGKPNGAVCSNDCSKQCCRCPDKCNRH